MKIVSEIFLTSKYVTEESWLNLIFEISKLNGRFRKWDIFIKIELNTVRYFIKTSRELPPVINTPMGERVIMAFFFIGLLIQKLIF